MTKYVAIVSGGLDSVVLAHLLKSEDRLHSIVSFNYGQRHVRELRFAESCAAMLGVRWEQVTLPIGKLLRGSALTDPSIDVPRGHYADQTMRITVVPNRNAIMLSVATGYAVATKAGGVALAIHAGDHAIYPDCRPEFRATFQAAMRIGNEGFALPDFTIYAPFVTSTKAAIVGVGAALHVPMDLTWSCYEGRDLHCGECGTCVERKEAFVLARVEDPTQYEDAADRAAHTRQGLMS